LKVRTDGRGTNERESREGDKDMKGIKEMKKGLVLLGKNPNA
jgi:hypothetical protein